MNHGALKIALAASVALNLFALAAGGAAWANLRKADVAAEAPTADPRPGGERKSPMAIVQGLDPSVRDQVRERLRLAARSARPDFEEARARRREAIAVAKAETYEPERVLALLEQSRTAERAGRARLEAEAVAVMGTLQTSDRQALADILNRRSRGGDRARKTSASTPTPSS